MRHLVWHWGRRGAGPVFAARLAEALNTIEAQSTSLSLASGAEILAGPSAPHCDWPEPTYATGIGYAARRLMAPFYRREAERRLSDLAPDLAICAMPSLLDRNMIAALKARRTDYVVIVHDAEAHPGEALRFKLLSQDRLLRGARHLFCLSGHVENALRQSGYGRGDQKLTRLWHPHMGIEQQSPIMRRPGRPRLLHFGRLLPYKGLDLLANALELIGPQLPFELRICGEGPSSPALTRLRAMQDVQVEARWFAETELPELLAWADALVLPYREASQSGVASMGLAAGRHVLATSVGGLPEQLAGMSGALLCAPNAPAIATALLELTETLLAPGSATLQISDWRQDWHEMATRMLDALYGWETPRHRTMVPVAGSSTWQPVSGTP